MTRSITPSAVLARLVGAGALAGLVLASGGAWAGPPAAAVTGVIEVADNGYGSPRQALSGAELAANRGAGLEANGVLMPRAGIVLWDEATGRGSGALSVSLPPGAASSAASAGSGF